MLTAQSNKSLDASGGSVFRNLIRPAMLDRIRAAASTQPLRAITMEPIPHPAKAMSPVRIAYEILALSGLAFELGTIIYKWAALPAVIPTHFGFSGQADDWSSKKWLLLLPALSLVLYIGLTWLSRYPHKLN